MEKLNYSLSEKEVRDFQENGYIGPFTLCSPEEMKEFWGKIRLQVMNKENAIYNNSSEAPGIITNIGNYDRHFDIPLLMDHICNKKIVDRVASLLGPDVLCWRSEFFPKYKGDEGTDWHQASTFANASGKPQIVWPTEDNNKLGGTITVWCAFTDSTLANGCLQIMPKTHNKMYYDESKTMEFNPKNVNNTTKDGVKRGFFGYDYRQLQIDSNWKPDESQAVPLVMKAGQFIIFWSTLMHASLPHISTLQDMRLGFVGRYIPTRVKVYPNTKTLSEYGGSVDLEKYRTVLVSGKDTYNLNKVEIKS